MSATSPDWHASPLPTRKSPLLKASSVVCFFEHIEHLKKLDVTGVEPTAHTSAVFNCDPRDIPGTSLPRAAALGIAPRTANNLVIVPKVVE